MRARERVVWCFVGVFYYAVLPASCFFSAVSGLIMSAYSFKATLYVLTGSISLGALPMPEAITISRGEFFFALLCMVAGGALLWLYTRYSGVGGGGRSQPSMQQQHDNGDATPLDEDAAVVIKHDNTL